MAKAENFKKVPVNMRMTKWLNDWLNEQEPDKIALIEEALIEYYKLTPPKPERFKSSLLDL